MKRLLIAAVVCLCAVGFAVADEPAPAKECKSKTADQLLAEWRVELEKTGSRNAGGLPQCPAISNSCTGGAVTCSSGVDPCGISGTPSYSDTGLQKCEESNGNRISCPVGQTVHLKAASCAQCPCCTATPACACPGSGLGCGEVSSLLCL